MAFVLEQSPTFSHPITIREVLDGGKIRTHQFTAIFNRLTQTRMEEVQLQYQAIQVAARRGEAIDGIPTREIANEILAGWDGITTASGEPVEMTSATKAQLLDRAAVADALVVTFFDAHEKARAKN
jgi:hypothetical protein